MSGGTLNVKNYPDAIYEEFEFRKAKNYCYIKVLTDLEDSEVEAFLREPQTYFGDKSLLGDKKKILIPFQLPTIQDGCVIRFPVEQEAIDEIIGMIEQDDRIDIVRPVYFRQDQKNLRPDQRDRYLRQRAV